jgi:hypothetical protein
MVVFRDCPHQPAALHSCDIHNTARMYWREDIAGSSRMLYTNAVCSLHHSYQRRPLARDNDIRSAVHSISTLLIQRSSEPV